MNRITTVNTSSSKSFKIEVNFKLSLGWKLESCNSGEWGDGFLSYEFWQAIMIRDTKYKPERLIHLKRILNKINENTSTYTKDDIPEIEHEINRLTEEQED